VTASAVMAPAVAVLLRLSLACYLGLPLESVFISSAGDSSRTFQLASTDAVNTLDGNCSAVTTAAESAVAGRGLLWRPLRSGPNAGARRARPRSLEGTPGSGAGNATSVSLVAGIRVCGGADPAGEDAISLLPASISALLAGLANSSSSSSGGGFNGSGTSLTSGLPLQFGAFLVSLAAASNVSTLEVTATALIGSAWIAAAPDVPIRPGNAASNANGDFPIAAVAGAAGGFVIVAAAAVLVAILVRRRRQQQGETVRKHQLQGVMQRSVSRMRPMVENAGGAVVAGENPMLYARRGGITAHSKGASLRSNNSSRDAAAAAGAPSLSPVHPRRSVTGAAATRRRQGSLIRPLSVSSGGRAAAPGEGVHENPLRSTQQQHVVRPPTVLSLTSGRLYPAIGASGAEVARSPLKAKSPSRRATTSGQRQHTDDTAMEENPMWARN
jgi:hypothetical protein